MRARCGGGAAAWVAGVLAAPGTQGSWRLGQQKYSALEGHGNQYWAIHSSILAWRNPLPDREVWKATVYRVSKSWARPKQPCVCRRETHFACGSSAPVKVECEGGASAWLAGTVMVLRVQGHGLPLAQELWRYQSLFTSLL